MWKHTKHTIVVLGLPEGKSLGGEWFDFVVDRGLKKDDKVIFDLEEPAKKMYVEHVAWAVRKRKGICVSHMLFCFFFWNVMVSCCMTVFCPLEVLMQQ